MEADLNRPASVFLYRIADPKTHQVLPIEQWALEASVPNTADQDLQGANRVAVWGSYASVGLSFRTAWVSLMLPIRENRAR